MKKILPLALIVLGCTSMQSGAAPQTTPAAAASPASQFKNLQIFPQDIPRDELIAAMRVFTRSLGVRCNHCHVVTATEPKEVLDFPADTKEEKKVARVMLRMVMELNQTWLPRVEAAEGHAVQPMTVTPHDAASGRIGCWTCHRGKTEPEMPPAPEPRPAG
ncbi:MAG TPA: c-type cytochrome [Thermoanaerobaculia bacterium]|nr:c-type cytochrome [Thermoanaerobaculia bacterium]